MASGFAFGGGRSRCFEHWQEFQKCYVKADFATDCVAEKGDYLECLHHTKEVERLRTIRDTYLERQTREAQENRAKGDLRATSNVLRLGIIGKDEEGGDSSSGAAPAESSESGSKSKQASK